MHRTPTAEGDIEGGGRIREEPSENWTTSFRAAPLPRALFSTTLPPTSYLRQTDGNWLVVRQIDQTSRPGRSTRRESRLATVGVRTPLDYAVRALSLDAYEVLSSLASSARSSRWLVDFFLHCSVLPSHRIFPIDKPSDLPATSSRQEL